MNDGDGNPFFMILDKTTARELIPSDRSLITIPSTATVHEVITLLSSHRILSCPVLDSSNQCIGSVDFFSILKMITSFNGTPSSTASGAVVGTHNMAGNDHTDPHHRAFHTLTALHLIPYSTPLVPYYIENPVSHLVDILSQIHRAALYKKDHELVSTISQSDVLRFISRILTDVQQGASYTRRYSAGINALCQRPLTDFHDLFHKPFVLSSNHTLADAIIACRDNLYRVIGIVKPSNGAIMGDFRVEDLPLLTPLFFNPVEYLHEHGLEHIIDSIAEDMANAGETPGLGLLGPTSLLPPSCSTQNSNRTTSNGSSIQNNSNASHNDISSTYRQLDHSLGKLRPGSSAQVSHILRRLTLHDWVTIVNPKNNHQVPCIKHEASFENSIHLMLSCKTHHLWVVDANTIPTRVVTMTDLLGVLSSTKVNLATVSDGLGISKLWKLN